MQTHHGLTQHDWTEAEMHESTNRANQSNRGPESRAYERGVDHARGNETSDQKMAKKTAKERPYGSKNQDDEEDDLETNQPTKMELPMSLDSLWRSSVRWQA